jgi:cytidylate kinase
MNVITISRQFGSGGDEIAERVCHATGFHLFDKYILAKAALESGLSEQELIDYSEDHYKVKNFLHRLLGRSRTLAQVRIWKEDASGVRSTEEMRFSEEDALALTLKAVQTAYKVGSMVIMGRGGQVILKGEPDAFHVRVIAPLEDRLLRLRNSPIMAGQTFASSVEARRAAQDLVEANDAASADYLRNFFGVDWADPLLYHLVINTGKVSLEQAAHLIIQAVKQPAPAGA